MTGYDAALRRNGGLLWSWRWQIGPALFARLNIDNIDLLGGSRRVLIDDERQAVSLVASDYRHDNFRRGRRRRFLRSCSNSAQSSQADHAKGNGSDHVGAPFERLQAL